jgi:hypothetical protein
MVLKDAMQSGGYSVYVGMTRQALSAEFLRFLTTRGTLVANSGSSRNRPILMQDEKFKKHFTGNQAIEQLGAVCVEVFRTGLRANASAVEDRLQTFIKETLEVKYPQRLFRAVAKGKKREDEDTLDGKATIHRTFLTIFKIVDNSADWGEEGRNKSYPKSVQFVNLKGKETTVFIQA